MGDYTGGGSNNRNFDDLDIESSNTEDFQEPQPRVKQTPEEKHLLKHCIVELDDGRHGYVFSYEEDERGVGSYFCHVCQSTLFGWIVVNQHISGKKHSTAMQKTYHPLANFSRIVEEDPTVELQPGEPAPPGMEDMVEPKKCIIQTKLDSFKSKPLIGLEYLVELLEDNVDPNYYCLLCNKQGVNNNIIIHLSSQMHYLKYLQKYFSNVYSALVLVPKSPDYKKGFTVVVGRIIARIENKYGRLKPRQCQADLFHQGKKFDFLQMIENEFHFRETIQDDYINMVDWSEIKRLQFFNEDDEVPASSSSSQPDNTDLKSESEISNKSLFNKAGRINVDKRQLRKDRGREDTNKDHEKSPDVVVIGESKKLVAEGPAKKNTGRRNSLSSISTISSTSKNRSRSRSKSPVSRKRYRSPGGSRFRHRSRSRSHSPSSHRKYYNSSRHRRSRSRSPGRYNYRRSRSTSRSRFQRYRRNNSPVLPYPRRRRSYSKSRSRSPPIHHSRSPILVPRYLRFLNKKTKIEKPDYLKEDKLSQKSKWDKFREEFTTLSNELNDKYKFYEKNPEKHPQYPEEWKLFWNRRYKELQLEGKDPAKHDFKPEWITFWNARMKEIQDNEFNSGKESLKLKFGLEAVDEKKKDSDVKTDSKMNEMKKDVTVDDIKNTWKALTGSEIKEGTKSPSSSTVGDEVVAFDEHFENRHLPTHLHSRLPPPGARQGFIPFDDDSPRVISVLRMISVLESQIGSLGPRVVDLLSKAIAMEKTCRGSSQDVLYNEEHCVLFETVKEKLKGMLFAGLVDRNFVNMTKVALRHIEDLFLCVPKVFKKEIPSYIGQAPAVAPATPVIVPGVGTVDRVAIAQQIAGALIAQGKTDVTEDELEQLINAVVGMAQASSNSGAPITTAEYIQRAQHVDPVTNNNNNTTTTTSSVGLKMLQSAYNEDENKSHTEGNTDPVVLNKLHIVSATEILNNNEKELSDQDLKCLLSNFRDLPSGEQAKLISHFKKLESTDPKRIALLQKNIDMRSLLGSDTEKISNESGQLSPFSARSAANNPSKEEPQKNFVKVDDSDDDDDYSVEDVYKAASEKLRQQELSQERKKIELMLADIAEAAKKGDAIANLTASFQFPQNNTTADKRDDSATQNQNQLPVVGQINERDRYQVPDKDLQNYSSGYYPQSSMSPRPVVDQIQNNLGNGNNSYAYQMNNPNSNVYPSSIGEERRNQFRSMEENRIPYSSGSDISGQYPYGNRELPYPRSSMDRYPPDFQDRFEPPVYGDSRSRNYPRYYM